MKYIIKKTGEHELLAYVNLEESIMPLYVDKATATRFDSYQDAEDHSEDGEIIEEIKD